MILYSAKSTIDAEGRSAYRVTKFSDGDVESSYLTDGVQCECPAGTRPTCRHRRMLPDMITTGIVNTHWFYDFDEKLVCDFEGTPKYVLDRVLEPEREALQDVTPAMIVDAEEYIDRNPSLQSKPWRRF